MDLPIVTVFGGTGFLGRRVVRRLRAQDFRVRIAVRRRPEVMSCSDVTIRTSKSSPLT
jgi:nucleoside-diphosphate-sugar epimerase